MTASPYQIVPVSPASPATPRSRSPSEVAPGRPSLVWLSGVDYDLPVGKRLQWNATRTSVTKTPLLDPRKGQGRVLNKAFSDIRSLFDFLLESTPRRMFFSGTWAEDLSIETVLPAAFVEDRDAFVDDVPSAVSATKENLQFRNQAGLIAIDIDAKPSDECEGQWPPEPRRLHSKEEVLRALEEVLPEANGCPKLILPSSGSMIVDAESGKLVRGAGGWRVLIVTNDSSQTPRILKLVEQRCWAHGQYNEAFVSRGGDVLVRSLADQAMSRPTQPNYLVADLGPQLERAKDCVLVDCVDGSYFSPQSAVLSHNDELAAARRIADARKELQPLADSVKTVRISKDVASAASRGVPRDRAEHAATAKFRNGILLGCTEIAFEDGEEVSAARLLGSEGARYDRKLCLDPVEPEYDGGRPVGIFYWNEGVCTGVHTLAHGSRFYRIRHDDETALEAVSAAGNDKAALIAILAGADLTPIGEKQAQSAVAKALKLRGLREIRNEVGARRRLAAERTARFLQLDAIKDRKNGIAPLDQALTPSTFPQTYETDRSGRKVLDHVENIEHMLKTYGIGCCYNVISKKIEWQHGSLHSGGDNAEIELFSQLLSLCSMNGVPKDNLQTHMTALANRRSYNPVTDHLRALIWDGIPRFDLLASAMEASDSTVARIGARILLIQACAAADHGQTGIEIHPEFHPHFEIIVVFVGGQGIGKTRGARRLLPKALWRYFKEGVVLDLRDKDSVKRAVSTWFCELGELDSTFKKSDYTALKAFMSNSDDEIRMPYAAKSSTFERRTVFIGTVNDLEFLADPTGNRRFLPLAVSVVDPEWTEGEIDQLWAEAWHRYSTGERWWPAPEEESQLADNAECYRAKPAIEDAVERYFAWGNPPDPVGGRRKSADIYRELVQGDNGLPTVQQTKALNAALRRKWVEHGAAAIFGELKVQENPGGAWVNVNNAGGKNPGWLLPPRRLALLTSAVRARPLS